MFLSEILFRDLTIRNSSYNKLLKQGNTVLQTNMAQELTVQFKPPSAAHLAFPLIRLITSM